MFRLKLSRKSRLFRLSENTIPGRDICAAFAETANRQIAPFAQILVVVVTGISRQRPAAACIKPDASRSKRAMESHTSSCLLFATRER